MAGLDLAKVVSCSRAVRMDFERRGRSAHGYAADAGRRRSTSSPTTSASSTTSCGCSPSAAAGSPSCRRRRPRDDVLALKPDGVFLANGPGDPEPCDYAIAAIREIVDGGTPTFGICLGHQLLGLASGGRTVKMKFGHHGANHPVLDKDTGQVLITSQNHGFAVDPASLPAQRARDARLAVRRQPAGHCAHRPAGVQLPGPSGSESRSARRGYLFDRFVKLMEKRRQRQLRRSRTDIESILIIGAGPIIIGQACEFDYSGAQACKALREEGYRVILVNSNPATIMTDPEMADVTYIEPITWPMVATIIEKERPDALLPTMGGQTALNCALDLAREGVLEQVRRRADRRVEESDRQGRGPREVQGGDDAHRARLARARASRTTSSRRSQCRRMIGFPAVLRPIVHAGRHRRRHRLQQGRVRSRSASAGFDLSPDARAPDRGDRCSAGKSSRWRSCATARTTASSSARSRTSIRWACTPATRSPSRRRRR